MKQLFKKIKGIDLIILATFVTTVAYSSTYPYIHKIMISNVDTGLIALTNIVDCVAVIIVDRIWQLKGNKMYEKYELLCILECVTTVSTTLYVLTTHNIVAYYILDIIMFSITTRNIICGGRRLRAIRYSTEESRINYENNNSTAESAATLIGSGIAIILGLPFEVMLIIATIGNCIDNIFYIKIYRETKKQRTIEENLEFFD